MRQWSSVVVIFFFFLGVHFLLLVMAIIIMIINIISLWGSFEIGDKRRSSRFF